MRDCQVALLHARHPLAGRPTGTWKALARFNSILVTNQSSVRVHADRAAAAAGIDIEPTYVMDSLTTAVGLVRAGLGYAVLPSLALRSMDLGGAVARVVEQPRAWRDIGLLTALSSVHAVAGRAGVRCHRSRSGGRVSGFTTAEGRPFRGEGAPSALLLGDVPHHRHGAGQPAADAVLAVGAERLVLPEHDVRGLGPSRGRIRPWRSPSASPDRFPWRRTSAASPSRIARPAEPGLVAAAACEGVACGIVGIDRDGRRVEDVPAALRRRILLGAASHDGLPVHRLQIDLEAHLLQRLPADRRKLVGGEEVVACIMTIGVPS